MSADQSSRGHRADKIVLIVCVGFIALIALAEWIRPDPKFAACIEIPKQTQRLPATKAEVARFVKYYRRDL